MKQKALILGNRQYKSPTEIKEVTGELYSFQNVSFIICKDKVNKAYKMYELHTGLFVIKENTIKAIKEKINKMYSENKAVREVFNNIPTMLSLQERINKEKEIYSNISEYETITNTHLPIDFGVNVIKLSQLERIMEKDISLKEHITNKYGTKASELLENIINNSNIIM